PSARSVFARFASRFYSVCWYSDVSLPRVLPFTPPATPEIYTLSLHDALPICRAVRRRGGRTMTRFRGLDALLSGFVFAVGLGVADRKSTRLNSSHVKISYAVFCLKKKNLPAFPPHALYSQARVPEHDFGWVPP